MELLRAVRGKKLSKGKLGLSRQVVHHSWTKVVPVCWWDYGSRVTGNLAMRYVNHTSSIDTRRPRNSGQTSLRVNRQSFGDRKSAPTILAHCSFAVLLFPLDSAWIVQFIRYIASSNGAAANLNTSLKKRTKFLLYLETFINIVGI